MINLPLPQGVAAPIHPLWTQLKTKRGQFTIVGLHYVDYATALIERLEPGWHYTLSNVWGITDAHTLCSLRPEQNILSESDVSQYLEPVLCTR